MRYIAKGASVALSRLRCRSSFMEVVHEIRGEKAFKMAHILGWSTF